MERILSYAPLLADLDAHVRASGRGRDALVRQQLARLHGEVAVGRQLIYRIAWQLSQGVTPTADTALAKLYGSELEQRLAHFAGQVLGPYAVLTGGADVPLGGR